MLALLVPHELELWFYSWYSDSVETLDNFTLCDYTNSSERPKHEMWPFFHDFMMFFLVILVQGYKMSGLHGTSSMAENRAGRRWPSPCLHFGAISHQILLCV